MLKVGQVIIWFALSSPIYASIIIDGTLGPRVELTSPDYQITPDLGKTVGPNLFHSFEQFNLYSGESATFSGSPGIQTIISRVTGGHPSNIDGTIRSTIPNADMYFLNPYGILFGPHAKLDVQGGFQASTAHYLRLTDGGRFDALQPNNSLLTVAPVEAFGFLTDTVASLAVEGRGEITQTEWKSNSAGLQVAEGKTLSLIGGHLDIKNGTIFKTTVTDSYGEWVDIVPSPLLKAAHGQINLVSVTSPGEVIPSALGLERIRLKRLGNISLTGHSFIDVSGSGGGSVFILGDKVLINKSSIFAKTLGEEDGGIIDVQANNIELFQGGQLVGNTEGTGRGSHIHVRATDSITASGYLDPRYSNSSGFYARSGIWITLMGDEIGDGGFIQLEAPKILFEKGAEVSVSTNSGGHGGEILIKASDSLMLEGFDTDNDMSSENYHGYRLISSLAAATYSLSPHAGDAGDINIEAGHLIMNNPGATIVTTTEGHGKAGNISIKTDSISLSNNHPILTGPMIYSDTFSTGNAGQISIVAHKILLTKGSKISSQAYNTGNAGHVAITAHDISLLNHGLIATDTFSTGNAGDIQINTTGLLTIAGIDENGLKSTLSSTATSTDKNLVTGEAGTISLQANNIVLSEGGEINTSTQNASGGDIKMTVMNLLNLQQSQITTSVHGGQGDGGNITIDNPQFVVLNQAQLKAQANAGYGGNIRIAAEQFIATPDSLVSASSRLGIDGKVMISSPNEMFNNNFFGLSTALFDVSRLLPQPCGKRRFENEVNRSKFILHPLVGSALFHNDCPWFVLPTKNAAHPTTRQNPTQPFIFFTGCHP